jgi:hypothetical protein
LQSGARGRHRELLSAYICGDRRYARERGKDRSLVCAITPSRHHRPLGIGKCPVRLQDLKAGMYIARHRAELCPASSSLRLRLIFGVATFLAEHAADNGMPSFVKCGRGFMRRGGGRVRTADTATTGPDLHRRRSQWPVAAQRGRSSRFAKHGNELT